MDRGQPRGLALAFSVRAGRVESFDDQTGAGRVRDDETGDTWSFHATSIAEGNRTIVEGTWVTYTVRPGPVGLEAFAVTRRS